MHSEKLSSYHLMHRKRTINQNECKEKDRQHKDVQKLRNKAAIQAWYWTHTHHNFDVTKLQTIFISHKYCILVTKHHILSHFHPIYHNYFLSIHFKGTFAEEKVKKQTCFQATVHLGLAIWSALSNIISLIVWPAAPLLRTTGAFCQYQSDNVQTKSKKIFIFV